MSEFYDANSPLTNEILQDKSRYDPDNDITLCDSCSNILLVRYQEYKLLYPKYGNVYDAHYELVKVQEQETTLDELSSNGELGFKDEGDKIVRKILTHKEAKLENIEHLNKEFQRYRDMEIIDKDTITGLSKTRRITKLE